MKSKQDAVKALLAVGWSPTEIKSILQPLSEILPETHSGTNGSWWTYLKDDQFTDGTPLVEDWYNWLERGNRT